VPGFHDDFDGTDLDRSVWLPHYLPAWSSRAATAASYTVADSRLTLSVPPGHPVWCEGEHTPAIRVSGIQSGSFSGPVGSTTGQQPFRAGQQVREQQEEHWGWTPAGGQIELRARMTLSPWSMAAFWMVGLETHPEQCAEICVVEVFGKAVEPGRSAEVGMGVHAFRDPRATEDFAAPRLDLDVADLHDYAVDWTAERAVFLVDGVPVRTVPQPPAYPMQMMVAVFDFPDDFPDDFARDDHLLVPGLVVEHLTGSQGSASP
jgi:Glycosyl hydrolases family 16